MYITPSAESELSQTKSTLVRGRMTRGKWTDLMSPVLLTIELAPRTVDCWVSWKRITPIARYVTRLSTPRVMSSSSTKMT